MKPKLAIIQLPGSNCEYETERAANFYGFDTEIIRWNVTPEKFKSFDCYIIPGGFSFQDRVRAGAISAKLPVMGLLVEAADSGKPLFGICNGCQILAEIGLIPGLGQEHKVEVALTHNTRNNKPYGFICDWIYVKPINPKGSVFTKYFDETDVIPIPVNHAEGRFMLNDEVKKNLDELTLFEYCSKDGNTLAIEKTPNGSTASIAGMCNKKGNVMGIMPHPERAAFLKQVPFWIQNEWADKKSSAFKEGLVEQPGPWDKLFIALYDHLK
jgi:phosphoribosylformylglycinamidine synthase subunit PurQ / glutaminase